MTARRGKTSCGRASLVLLALAAALAAAPQAVAQEPPEPTIVLRGSVEPEAEPPPLAPAPPPPRRSDFPDADPVAPRMGGLAPTGTGGAACRAACAKSYYFCLSQDDAASCGRRWTQCLSDCPRASGAE